MKSRIIRWNRLLNRINEYREKGRFDTGNTKWLFDESDISFFESLGYTVENRTYYDYKVRDEIEYQFISWG